MKEIYSKDDIKVLLNNIKEQIESLDKKNNKQFYDMRNTFCQEFDKVNAHLTKLNSRTSKLEHWRTYIAGGIGVIGFLFTIFIYFVKDLLGMN